MALGTFLEDNPQAIYYARLPRLRSPLQEFFRNNYGQVYNAYQGAQGQQAGQTGQLPTLGFGEFLNKYNFNQDYMNQMGGNLARSATSFNPRTRWLLY